jgi:hypothetical protein
MNCRAATGGRSRPAMHRRRILRRCIAAGVQQQHDDRGTTDHLEEIHGSDAARHAAL